MSSDLKERFFSYIKEKNLFTKEDRLLIASSGGVDSTVLSHLLFEQGIRFHIAHVNYNLRGRSSIKDAEFIRSYCQKYFIPVHILNVEDKPNENVQAWARQIRYTYFDEIIEKEGLQYIVTGHNFDDQIETFLLNFTRGSGIDGLTGIPVVNQKIRRPLLFARKQDIHGYARKNKLVWREDETNKSKKYNRNIVRQEVVPVLDKLREHDLGMRHSFNHLQEVKSWLSQHFQQELANYQLSESEWKIPLRKKWNSSEQFELYQLISQLGFNRSVVDEICSTIRIGAIFHSKTHIAVRDRSFLVVRTKLGDEIIVKKIEAFSEPFELNIGSKKLRCKKVLPSELSLENNVVYFDLSKIKWPLHIRNWETGDRFQPFGMYGKTKKVSDLLIHLKLSRFDKDEVLVLLDDEGTLIWVVGYRRSMHAPVTKETTACLRLELF